MNQLALIAVLALLLIVGVISLVLSLAKVAFVGFALLFLAGVVLSLWREYREKLARESGQPR